MQIQFRRIMMMAAALVASLAVLGGGKAVAQQECMIGEVKMFVGNYAPRNWAFANGQLLPINQNQSLYAIIGTVYGGDGRTTLALPDLRGRVSMGPGQGPGLSNYNLGQKGGAETVAATPLASHSHAKGKKGASNNTTTNVGTAGGGQAMSIMQPYLTINHIICLQGTFPSRN